MAAEWPAVTIEEIAERVAMGPFGSSIKADTFVAEGVPIINGQHLRGFRIDDGPGFNFISEDHAERLANANVVRGDIVLTHRGNIGQVAYIPEKSQYERYVASQSQFYVRCDRSKALPEYLVLYFRSPEGQHQLLANASQVGVPSIAKPVTYVRTIEFPLPPLEEQRAIARVLGALDDKIELNRRMSETLEEMARALFRSWFVDFDPVRAKAEGRPSGLPPDLDALFPASFEASELGEIPAGWEVRTISSLASINDWTLRARDHLKLIDYVEISAVTTGNIERVQRYARGEEPSRARRRLRHGDTVLSTVRPDRGSYFLCLDPPDSLVASTGFAVLTPTEAPWALVHTAMTQPELFERLGHLADGAAYPAVRANVIGETVVSWCGADVAARFQEAVAPMYELAARGRRESHTLAELRDMLVPRLVSGELRVGASETWT